ncbi:MAG: O-antigen ligase family protein, partial [bacterium]|nr:O-antigen ligase family protein [bacterium]
MRDLLKWTVYAGIFAVPFVVLLVTESLFFPYITGKNFAFRIIVEVTFAAWILLALYEPQYRPRFSWILAAFTAFLAVIFLADLLGAYPPKSLWSNFERMEGFVTLIHVFFYFLVTASALTTHTLWNRFFATTLGVASVLVFVAFTELAGPDGAWRVDATLGNSTYMAIYMLFHIFIAALLFSRTKSAAVRYVCGTLMLIFTFFLFQTGTRGAVLGLFCGAVLCSAYFALFAKDYAKLRAYAVAMLVVLFFGVGIFVSLRDSAFVQGIPQLARVADISLEAGSTRFTIWQLALEGVKERPILGWGQENFNYVFNTYYDPSLYGQETWFDRVHNIVLDWLIAGGVVGAFLYFSIIGAALYYVVLQPLLRGRGKIVAESGKRNKRRSSDTVQNVGVEFTVAERSILLGLFAAYVLHNFFVFDNLISYIFFAAILAFIHAHVGWEIPKVRDFAVRENSLMQVAAPVAGVALLVVVYAVNAPGILAAHDVLEAIQTPDPALQTMYFERAYARNSFADQEIGEQMLQRALAAWVNGSQETGQRAELLTVAEEEFLKQIARKPGDARLRFLLATFYRVTGNFEKAILQADVARTLSPKKQVIIFEQGFARLQSGQGEDALAFFEEAYELAPTYDAAREY